MMASKFLNSTKIENPRRLLCLNFIECQHGDDILSNTPFGFSALIDSNFPNLPDCKSIDLRRFKSVKDESQFPFVEIGFVEAIWFKRQMAENHSQMQRGKASIYEELQTVEWHDIPMDMTEDEEEMESAKMSRTISGGSSSSNWGEYKIGPESSEGEEEDWPNEEGNTKTGHILIAYKSSAFASSPPADCFPSFRPFMADWRNWCAVRDLCQLLPSKCTFRKVSFYQRKHPTVNAQANGFQFILLLEVENALLERNSVLNCINNAQSLCFNRAHIGLYEEIEFEIELDVLQRLVALGSSINCNGHRLVVQFDKGEMAKEKLPMMPPFGFGGAGFFGRPSSSSPSSSSFFSEPQIGHSISANGQMISQSDSDSNNNNNNNSNNNDYDYDANYGSDGFTPGFFMHKSVTCESGNSDWQFDAEMEEIGEDESGNQECQMMMTITNEAAPPPLAAANWNSLHLEMINEGEEEEPIGTHENRNKAANLLNNNSSRATSIRRKGSWRLIKSLFSSTHHSPSEMESEKRRLDDLDNNNPIQQKALKSHDNAINMMEMGHKNAGRQQSCPISTKRQKRSGGKEGKGNGHKFSLNSFVGSFWRKISLK